MNFQWKQGRASCFVAKNNKWLLGHADIQTTHQYYAVFSPDELQEMHDKHIQLDLKGFDE